jgi:hypothetical protein
MNARAWSITRFCRRFDDTARAMNLNVASSERTVKKWRAGDVGRPHEPACRVLEKIFDVPVTDLLAPPPSAPPADPTEPRPRASHGAPRAEVSLPSAPDSRTAYGPTEITRRMDRRDFVAATAAALTFRPATPRHVDPRLIDYFDHQLEGHYRADMMLGPRELIGTVTAQHTLISDLIAAARGETRNGLLRASVAYAALVGWLYQDAGDLPTSSVWRGIALEAAQRSGDRQLVAYALVNHASVRADLGDGPGVLELCAAVLADASRLSPKVLVLALQQQAHGASFLGDRTTVDAVLDQAATHVENSDDGRPWGNACRRTPAYLEIQRATCYGRMGLGEAAAELWEQILRTAPCDATRDRGVYFARQATACVQSGDPGRAVEPGRLAADLALTTGSMRIRREFAGLARAAQPWSSTAVGRELAEIFTPMQEI